MILYLLLLGFLVWLWYTREKAAAKNRPPGPMQFPLFGSLIEVATTHPVSFIALDKLSKKYGDCMSIKMGIEDFVFVSSFDSIKAFYGGEDCIDRPCGGIWFERNFCKNLGLIFGNGPVWSDIRRFSVQVMRNVGFLNKEWLRNILDEELHNFSNHFEDEAASHPDRVVKFTPSGVVKLSFTNLICAMISGKCHNYNDKKLQDLVKPLDKFFRSSTQVTALMTAYPGLRYLLRKTIEEQFEFVRAIHQYSRDLIAERQKLGIYKHGDATCYIDAFLQKMDDTKTNPNSIYTDEHFLVNVTDFFTAGSETTANWFLFAVLLLMTHPEKQEKLYNELKTVVGDRLPEPEDKDKLIYTQAVMLEVHRWAKVTINLGPRYVVRDFVYNGYFVKKGTNVLANIYPVFHDRAYWGDPDVFRPERFIGEDGKLTKTERMIPFGMGKRVCFGEHLAKESAFMYLARMVYRYEFKLPDLGNPPSLKLLNGITTCPSDFEAKLVKRE